MVRFKSKKLARLSVSLCLALIVAVEGFWALRGEVWTGADFQILDLFYRRAVADDRGPRLSPRILYLTITDASYEAFGKNTLDRTDLAKVNQVLGDLGVEAVGFDIIFARPSREEADRAFADSLEFLGTAYLPGGFALSDEPSAFRWKERPAYERFRNEVLFSPREQGEAHPFYAAYALMQMDDFALAAMGSGHISAYSDPDGVYRHAVMLIRIGDRYVPTLSLSMFLDYMRIPFEDVIVEWGKRIVIPALEEGFLESDVVIPIDSRGRAFIPFPKPWEKGAPRIEAHALLEYYENPDLRGNLMEYFEGSFVLLGDVSIGTADLGQTPLESDVPLVVIHGAMLNGLMTNTFFQSWSALPLLLLVAGIGLLLGGSALFRSSWILYGTGTAALAGLVALTWFEVLHFRLFPLATAGGSILLIGFGLVAGIEWGVSRERSFIKNAFSRYVPEEVVHQLLLKPELLRLGGEERVISVLFSDLANFTSISERMTPTELVLLLNEYLTEMTRIVLDEGGIVDKYEGDAIMAEFGAPLELPDHADRAVRAGLRMQVRLRELRRDWGKRGLPEMRCRVGINTGPMVVGNMGSHQVLDYTVIGDAVNLASRLEGANKRYNTYLMISEFTLQRLTPGRFQTRILDVIRVKGKSEAVRVHEVMGESSDPVDPDLQSYAETYEKAFTAYLSRDFEAARTGFKAAVAMRPDDPASRDMIERMAELDPRTLPDDWDGSVALTSK